MHNEDVIYVQPRIEKIVPLAYDDGLLRRQHEQNENWFHLQIFTTVLCSIALIVGLFLCF